MVFINGGCATFIFNKVAKGAQKKSSIKSGKIHNNKSVYKYIYIYICILVLLLCSGVAP